VTDQPMASLRTTTGCSTSAERNDVVPTPGARTSEARSDKFLVRIGPARVFGHVIETFHDVAGFVIDGRIARATKGNFPVPGSEAR